jgi:hypothetical protein
MKITIHIFLLLASLYSSAQESPYYRARNKNKEVVLTPYDNGQLTIYHVSGLFESAKKVIYRDTTNAFEVILPEWFYIRETNDLNMLGGTLPAVNKTENAISVKSMNKKTFQDFPDFKRYIIGDSAYKPGVSPKWSTDRTFTKISKDSIPGFNYDCYKVSFNRMGKIFVCNYVLSETTTSYLWIFFTATEDTYDINIAKFYDFLKAINKL